LFGAQKDYFLLFIFNREQSLNIQIPFQFV